MKCLLARFEVNDDAGGGRDRLAGNTTASSLGEADTEKLRLIRLSNTVIVEWNLSNCIVGSSWMLPFRFPPPPLMLLENATIDIRRRPLRD